MTPFDATGKGLIELGPADWLAFLGQPRPPELVHVIDADLSATVSTATDKVIRVDDPNPWLALIELQAAWDGDLPFDLLRRYALLRHRHRLPVSCVIVLLRPDANTSAMTGRFLQNHPLGRDWEFPFVVVRVWEIPAETFLRGPLAVLPLAPVANVDEQEVPRVLAAVKDRADREATRSHSETLWESALQLMALRYDKVVVEKWSEIMATLDISKTSFAEFIRGNALRDATLMLGRDKFGEPLQEVVAALNSIHDEGRLRDLLRRVPKVNSWQELLAE